MGETSLLFVDVDMIELVDDDNEDNVEDPEDGGGGNVSGLTGYLWTATIWKKGESYYALDYVEFLQNMSYLKYVAFIARKRALVVFFKLWLKNNACN